MLDALHKLTHADLPKSDLLGPSTVNIGTIKGGVAPNVIPGHAEAFVMIRVSTGLDEIVATVKQIASESEHLKITELHTVKEQLLDYKVPGFESIILAYATDVPYLKGGFTRYLYGSGTIHVAHSPVEFVPVDELYDSVDGYKKLVTFSLNKWVCSSNVIDHVIEFNFKY